MRLTRWLGHPARVVPVVYLIGITVGTLLLMLPQATTSGESAPLLQAAFTAVSAVCITGLTTVDTATFWSPVGQFIIMALIQVGGFGIVALASLLTMVVTGRISLQGAMVAGQELRTGFGSVLRVPRMIAAVMLSAEAVTAVVLTLGFRPHTDSWASAVWQGAFHAVSAFNNAGFALYSDNLMSFVGEPGIIVPICVAVVLGGLGFPVLLEVGRRLLRRAPSNSGWSTQTRLTVAGTVSLLVLGAVVFGLAEWNNPNTIGNMSVQDRSLAVLAGAVFPRTAGFNSIDYGGASESTLGLYYVLMFIGGGSAGTAGGVKVGTIGIILATVVAELRGENQVVVGPRAIPATVQRAALAVVILGSAAVAVATYVIVATENFTLQQVLFETISAFGTVGLTTGITPRLKPESLVILMLLMYLGRVGTVSVAAALALRARHRRYVLPEEQPIVG
ncbi:TrkH family potassium uptake protein [Tessaracoccus sp. OS52]|uniref:TrkH family potassium uptake protein n=1 Tax=Tessaracoccus sp. OS52 TaxID=2886691 RepID=UPI001D114CCE|nr:potassium transporter TrkG [Tessaracoccus sp. OS52]MCC2594344.1 TrkH family potassium uptake protein [Tessaracoccus sp. OS52]